ncbi:hypothetical protein DITRI_Ditri17bG0096200 [Diplodiscus trichospermus]
MAAEECTAASPTPHSWWDLHPAANSLSSWSTGSSATNTATWLHHHRHQNPPNSAASNCDQDDLSISTSLTNASNHSGLTVESSGGGGGGGCGRQLVDQPAAVAPPPSTDLINGEHASDNHLWSHVLSSVGSNGDLRNGSPHVGENLFEAISSKSTSSGIFEPACDYLKKIESNWEFPNSSVFNSFFKNLNGYDTSADHDHQSSIESTDQRFTKLSNLVSNWSIAPPDTQINPHFNPKPCHDSMENYSDDHQQQPAFCGMAMTKNPVFVSCYGDATYHHDVKMEPQSLDMEAPTPYFRRAFKGSNSNRYHHHHNSFINNSISMEADNFYGSSTINSSRFSKPLVDINHASKPSFRPLSLSDCKKQGVQAANSLQTRNSNGRTQGTITNEGKKKRSGEETSDMLKKPKHENSTASSVKMQAPKVKLGDKITALQQIVSPFGKTDTASVLLEAIGYINFLQEQVQVKSIYSKSFFLLFFFQNHDYMHAAQTDTASVCNFSQLLSNPYIKPSSHKDPWGSFEGKDEKGDMKVDLRSRGLCLVPISCAPQVCHESTGSDYWTPTYRGCLYR